MSYFSLEEFERARQLYQPRVHGNGFIQLNLNPEGTRRLHVWHEDVPRQVVATPIHDHVFTLRSKVLCGTLIHTEYKTRFAQDGTHRVYVARQEEGSQNTTLVPEEMNFVRPVLEQRLVLGAGSIYTFPSHRLHDSDSVGLTATVMEKIDVPASYGRPWVLVPIGSEPDNNFRRDEFDPKPLWAIIDKAVGWWSS